MLPFPIRDRLAERARPAVVVSTPAYSVAGDILRLQLHEWTPSLNRLVSKLFELTNSGKLKWETTSDPNRFVVVLKQDTVEIEESDPWYDSHTGKVAYDDSMTVHDEVCRSLDTIAQKDLRGDVATNQHSLTDLYRVARSSALDSDEAVQELLTELDAIGLN